MTIKRVGVEPLAVLERQKGIGGSSRHGAASESQTAAVFSAFVAVLLFLMATIVSHFWASSLHESHFRADVLMTLKWVQYASVLAAVGSIILCLMPTITAALWSRWGIFLIPWAAIALFLWYKDFAGAENEIYILMVREDSLVEYLTALFFLGAAIFSGLLAITLRRKRLHLACLFFAGMAGLTLFMGLEEISYGQRIFGITTPSKIATDNTQGELNFHNLKSLKWIAEDIAPGVIIKWGLFGWVAVALTRLLSAAVPRRFELLIKLVFPPWYVAPYFLPFAVWAYKFSYPWLWPTAVWQDQEPAEMFLGLGFFVFCAVSYRIGNHAEARAGSWLPGLPAR